MQTGSILQYASSPWLRRNVVGAWREYSHSWIGKWQPAWKRSCSVLLPIPIFPHVIGAMHVCAGTCFVQCYQPDISKDNLSKILIIVVNHLFEEAERITSWEMVVLCWYRTAPGCLPRFSGFFDNGAMGDSHADVKGILGNAAPTLWESVTSAISMRNYYLLDARQTAAIGSVGFQPPDCIRFGECMTL